MPKKAAGPERPAEAAAHDAARRGADIENLVKCLRSMAPPASHGASALAALDRLLERPAPRRAAALPEAFEAFTRACAAAGPEPEEAVERVCAHVRERHAALLADPAFARLVEGPRRRANMLEWLLHENAGSLERARAELQGRSAEVERLREELARMEAERGALEADLARSRTLADRGLAAAGLAHDFNNLLQTVVGHATIAMGDLPAGHPEHEALQRVVEAARRATELSHGLARWERDERPPERSTDVNRAVEGVLDLLAVSAPGHVEEQRVLLAGLPAARMDPTDLRRVVLNLVVNAWQAIGARTGTVRVSSGIRSDRGEDMVYVEVEDDGPGLADDVRQRVFEPFYTTREGGSGIGLPTVRLLVERWGGRIEAWSVPGKGARFRASLPVAREEAGEAEA